MITLDKIYRLVCTFSEGSLHEMQSFPDKMRGCYRLTVEPFSPTFKEELKLAIDTGKGPNAEVDLSEVYGPKYLVYLETIKKPYAPQFAVDGTEPAYGDSLTVHVRPELKFNRSGEYCYPQLSIVSVDKR